MRTSVIIPVWANDNEAWRITRDCIDSFKAAEGNPIELIIVDNASSVGGGYYRDESSLYVRFPKNVGYTVAINYGITLATGDVIALANNDIKVAPNWEVVAREILKDESIATVHPRMIDYNDHFYHGELTAPTGYERWCQNSFVVTSKSFLDTLKASEAGSEPFPGLFDQNYGIGGGADDWDFYFRVRKIGKTCYTNKTEFQHYHSYSLQKLSDRSEIVKKNDDYFTKKWGRNKEEWFNSEFPEQMKKQWRPFP